MTEPQRLHETVMALPASVASIDVGPAGLAVSAANIDRVRASGASTEQYR